MKGNRLTLAPLCWLLGWMLLVDSFKISVILTLPEENQVIPMSMAEDAVDDMYFMCNKTMLERIHETYFDEENTETFAKVWKNAQGCAKRKLNEKDKEDEALTIKHMQAICVYTSGYQKFHKTFNDAVQNSRSTSFPFHSLHYWLTSAIQILGKNKKCHTTYRRTNVVYSGEVNQIVRFGFFASSSYDTTLTDFGTKTCFKITTCSGAFLKHYSTVNKEEQEVLIPPYEKFKITGKKTGVSEGLDKCDVVYILESTGVQSNQNCKAAYS
ncbi:erythroblast NAD(P)(+)--arginine ADP-ribosyltransferase-like [Thunnus maccoyii]|uniref:erythroblast NAD(P)(+)--arginine ADP-ribosyltransferase-like n=1 Tax=Thunnus maccoyii TaxID=8240 RepID=UPI001C4B434B|nr:erythroblast NAD(P)(+)--arginine ADP-ribosyltransferase-like [Thunnus maccoyii]